jgi:intracellular septation protein
MQALTEFAPLAAFIVAYYLRGLYAATAVLMGAMLVLLAVDWLRLKRIPPMHALSGVLVLIFGGATLALHDRVFIQWKPTVFFWLVSLAFMGSFWIGTRTLAERLLGATLAEAFGDRLRLSALLWRRLNLLWAVFYALLGALNIVVLRNFSERAWVALKLVDFVLMLLFLLVQVLWLAARAAPAGEQVIESGDGHSD